MSLNGTAQTFIPYTLNGINTLATPNDISSCVKYNGNTSNTNLDGYDLGTTGTLSAQFHAIPDTLSNSESWVTYAISTNGNLSTVGGLITEDLTTGQSMYFTGGVVGAPNFQLTTMGTSGKVVVTDGNSVMSTTISAGQLDYITALTSQAGGVGQANTWTDVQIHSADVSTTGSARFIQPYNAVSADISTVVNRATLDSAIASLGAGILTLNNVWSGTNTFNSTLTTAVGQTTSINGALSTSLVDLGFTSASFTTAGITGAYTPPLGTITNPSGSTYQITQTAAGRSIMAISGFTPSVGITYIFEFNINCTIGTATISVEQDNILVSPALYPLTTGFNRVVGSFTYNGTPNTVVFKIYTGVASWSAQWDSFTLTTYSIGMNANMNALTVNNRFTQRYNALAGDVSTLVNRATMDSAISASATPNLLPLNNVWTGSNTFNNSLQVAGGNMTCSLGVIAKQTATVGSLAQIAGGGAGNSPYVEFLYGGSSRGYLGNASAVDLDLVAQNGAKLNFYTAGTKRLEIDTAGNITATTPKFIAIGTIGNINGGSNYAVGAGYMATGSLTLGDHTKNYGGGSSWNSNTAGLLLECAVNTEIAIHDAGDRVASFMYYSGNDITLGRDMGWGQSNIVIGGPLYCNNIPQNPTSFPYSHTLTYNFSSNQILRSQCMMRQVYKVDYISWGPGINMTYAFYKYNEGSPVRISGKYAGYCTFVGMPTMTIRIYSQNSGATRYYSFPTWQNITYAQTTYPIDIILNNADLPELGWFDIYIYNSYGMSTDINDQLWVNVQLLPVNSF